MVSGMDITHPSPESGGGAPRGAAMMASIDTKVGEWPAGCRMNKLCPEMVEENNIKAMLRSCLCLRVKQENRYRFLKNILIY